MKASLKTIILFSFIFAIKLSAETGDTLFISTESLKSGKIYLAHPSVDVKWRYNTGDDSTWASPDFDDGDWELVNPYLEMSTPEAKRWEGIGWFRKVIRIDSSLQNKSVGIYLHQDGASEIFLNGKKIFSFGNVSDTKQGEIYFDPNLIPFVFHFDTSKVYTIAIRCSNHSHLGREYLYKKFFEHLGFFLSIFDFNSNIESEYLGHSNHIALGWAVNGFTLAFSLIFFLLYFFYSKRKLNLYFAVFVFGIFLLGTSFFLELMWYHNLEILVLLRFILFLGISITFTFFLLFIYQIVYRRLIKTFWIFLLAFVFVNIVSFFSSKYIFNHMVPLGIIIAIMILESFRVIIIGIKRNVDNIWLLSSGVTLFLIFTATGYLLPENYLGEGRYVWETLSIIVLPVFMAIYLAKSYSNTQSDLEEKIITVKELSEKKIEQERINAELQLQAELERAENERKTKELEEARQLQLSMLPRELPQLPHLDIAAYMQTATEVGGDFYDFHVSKEGTLTAIIADATGHGMQAGMLVTATKGLFHNLAGLPDLQQIFHQFNQSLCSMELQPLLMSLLLFRIDGKKLEVINGGMPDSLVYRKKNDCIEEIKSSGPPLGAYADYPYEKYSSEISTDDVILTMTDGFAERFNEQEEIFGYEKCKDILKEVVAETSRQMIDHFNKKSDDWARSREPDDDLTFLILKCR